MDVESTVIDNTELALDVPEKTETEVEEPVSKEKKLEKYVVEMRTDDTCGACTDTEGMIKDDFVPKSEIPIEISKEEASDEQKKAGVPQSKICKIYDDGSKECSDVILGGDREEWAGKLNIKDKVENVIKEEEPQNPSDSTNLETSESKE